MNRNDERSGRGDATRGEETTRTNRQHRRGQMPMEFELAKEEDGRPQAVIKVVGVGGGGGNAINNMIAQGLCGVEFIAVNTDAQALKLSNAPRRVPVGGRLTKNMGAGANPEVGRAAAEEDCEQIREALEGSDMVFITAGLGGGTGTGAAPIVAQCARDVGALTVGVVTKPFLFEGPKRRKIAEAGLRELKRCVDTVITIPNQRLVTLAGADLELMDAFRMADDVLYQAVKGIADVITEVGYINVDFQDVRTIMSEKGMALMGSGIADGPERAARAARAAIENPLLEDVDMNGARGVLVNVTADRAVKLSEVTEACSIIQESAHEDATVIWGQVIDPSLGGAIRVTVLATGCGREELDDAPVRDARDSRSTTTTVITALRPALRPEPATATVAREREPEVPKAPPARPIRPVQGDSRSFATEPDAVRAPVARPERKPEPDRSRSWLSASSSSPSPERPGLSTSGRLYDRDRMIYDDSRPGFDSVSLDQLNGFYGDDDDPMNTPPWARSPSKQT